METSKNKKIIMSSVINDPLQDLLLKTEIYQNGTHIPFGKDNDLPRFLDNLIYESPTHAAILDFKQKTVLGNGFDMDEKLQNELDLVFEDGINYFFEKIVNDYVVYEGFAVQIIYNKAGNKINKIAHHPFHKIRAKAKNTETGKVDSFYYKEDWAFSGMTALEIATFNPEKAKEDKTQLYYFRKYTQKSDYYPIPAYFAGLNYILLEKDLSVFYKTVMNNSISPSLVVKVNMILDDAEKEIFAKNLEKQYVGVKNSNKLITIFSDGQENSSVDFEPIKVDNNEKLYNDLNDIITNKIITTHKVPKSLLAIDSSTGFSSNADELLASFQYFNSVFVKSAQNDIKNVFERVLSFNYPKIELTFKKFELIKKTFSESLLEKILTEDELRAMMGFDPKPKEKGSVIEEEIVDKVTKIGEE